MPALARLERELFGPGAWPFEVLDDEVRSQNRLYLVATVPSLGPVGVEGIERVIGYGGIAFGAVAEIMTVGVSSAAQGQGAGRALVEKLLAACVKRDIEEVFLEVRVDNAGAIALYRSLGFVDVRVRRGYYQPENIDALVMVRKRSVT